MEKTTAGMNVSSEGHENSCFTHKMRNNPVARNVLMTLGVLGIMATANTNGQNISSNQIPPAGLSASNEAVIEPVSKEDVINILQTNKDKLTKAYPSLKDEATWLRVIGTIATNMAKKETIDYLAKAFLPTSDEYKKLSSFGRAVEKEKLEANDNAVAGATSPASPILGSSKDKDKERNEREMKKNEKKIEDYLKQFNAVLADAKKWSIKHGECKKSSKGIFELSYKPEKKGDAETMGTAQYYSSLPTGDYEIDYAGTGGAGMILWMYNKAGETINRTILVDGINKINVSPDCVKIGFGCSASLMSPFQLNKLSIKRISELNDGARVVTTK